MKGIKIYNLERYLPSMFYKGYIPIDKHPHHSP